MLHNTNLGLPLLRTVVPLDLLRPALMPQSRVVAAGSCFATEMGQKLAQLRFQVLNNPFGTLFHPAAAAHLFDVTLGAVPQAHEGYLVRDGAYVHPAYHSKLAAADSSLLEHMIDAAHHDLDLALKEADWLIWTWGTALGQHLQPGSDPVANCHKLPQRLFESRRWSVDEVSARVEGTLNQLLGRYPQLHVLLSVSPVRYLRETARGNNLSKSVLLLAADRITTAFSGRVHYFGAYELLLDELRDYRWFSDDMLHPSAQAVDYIWQRLSQTWCSDETLAFIKDTERVNKFLAHRPLLAGDAHSESLAQAVGQYREKYPFADIQMP
jgi:hypothetical protein